MNTLPRHRASTCSSRHRSWRTRSHETLTKLGSRAIRARLVARSGAWPRRVAGWAAWTTNCPDRLRANPVVGSAGWAWPAQTSPHSNAVAKGDFMIDLGMLARDAARAKQVRWGLFS